MPDKPDLNIKPDGSRHMILGRLKNLKRKIEKRFGKPKSIDIGPHEVTAVKQVSGTRKIVIGLVSLVLLLVIVAIIVFAEGRHRRLSVNYYTNMLKTSEHETQWRYAAKRLAGHGEWALIEMENILKSPDESLWVRAAVCLAQMPGSKANEILHTRAETDGKNVRTALIPVIAERHGPGDFEIIKRATEDDDPFIRSLAAENMKHFPQSKTIPILIELLTDPKWLVSSRAATCLTVLTGRSFGTFTSTTSASHRDSFANAWRKWWNENKADFRLEPKAKNGHP